MPDELDVCAAAVDVVADALVDAVLDAPGLLDELELPHAVAETAARVAITAHKTRLIGGRFDFIEYFLLVA